MPRPSIPDPAGASAGAPAPKVAVEAVEAAAFTVPADAPESDGTLEWDSTTIVVVTARGGGQTGLGYTYAAAPVAGLIRDTLAPLVAGRDALAPNGSHAALVRAVRNLGRPGMAAMATSAIDVALWDLKARLLDIPLAVLLGQSRTGVPAYGSGGFTSYDDGRLARQLGGWAEAGLRWVKMKVGREPGRDPERVRIARRAIGPATGLFVDANGACAARQALKLAESFAAVGVSWFEEPVSSDDLAGLRLMVERAPPGMDIAAGEYGWDPIYFRRMLAADAVDVLQADATRCGGITGFLKVAALAEAWGRPLSAHTAPSLHAPLGCACPSMRHVEFFHDHARIEALLFDGAAVPRNGDLVPDPDAPGLGLTFKAADAARYAVPS